MSQPNAPVFNAMDHAIPTVRAAMCLDALSPFQCGITSRCVYAYVTRQSTHLREYPSIKAD